MKIRPIASLCVIVLIASCSDGSTEPEPDPRTTVTFTLTTTVLTQSGGMSYPAGTAVPTFTTSEAGLVDATVSFDVVLDCEYVFTIDPTSSPGNPVLSTRSGSQELALSGEIAAGSYVVGITARQGGNLCNGLPAEGVPFPHTIVVTHP